MVWFRSFNRFPHGSVCSYFATGTGMNSTTLNTHIHTSEISAYLTFRSDEEFVPPKWESRGRYESRRWKLRGPATVSRFRSRHKLIVQTLMVYGSVLWDGRDKIGGRPPNKSRPTQGRCTDRRSNPWSRPHLHGWRWFLMAPNWSFRSQRKLLHFQTVHQQLQNKKFY